MYGPFAWEEATCSRVGLTISQLRFLISLYLSVPLSLGPRLIGSRTGRHLYAILVGILLLFYPFGVDVWHAFLPSLATYLGLKIWPKKCSVIGWGITFPYLVLLMGTMGRFVVKAVYGVGINHVICLMDLNTYQKKNAVYDCPSVLEFISYIFSVGGLLGGPHFEYRDYKDYMDRSGVWRKSLPFSSWHLFRPIFQAWVCMALYLSLYPSFNFRIYVSEAFTQMSLFKRYWTTWLISLADRTKYYHVWSIAEANINISGFGCDLATSEGDGDKDAEWKRGQNVKPIHVELSDSFTLIASHWNISTGNFLRRYVYDRITPPGKKASFWVLLSTQVVSGVWHGLYAGYWLFFISTAICIFASRAVYKQTRNLTTNTARVVKYPLLVFTSTTLAYMSSSFQVLDFRECFATWKKLYFLPHAACVSILLLSTLQKKNVKSA